MTAATPERIVHLTWDSGHLRAQFPRSVAGPMENTHFYMHERDQLEALHRVDQPVVEAAFAVLEHFASMLPMVRFAHDRVEFLFIVDGPLHADDQALLVSVLQQHLPHFQVDPDIKPAQHGIF